MDKAKLATFTSMLKQKQTELEKELATFTVKDPRAHEGQRSEFPQFGDSQDDNTTEVEVYQNRISVEQQLEEDLRDVKDALEKITKGTYGICEKTGKPIEEKRLMVTPEARYGIEASDDAS